MANGPRSQCNLSAIVKHKPGQSTEIWGRRHMVDSESLATDTSEKLSISCIEVMMVKTDLVGHLAGQLGPSRAPESTKLNNVCWGINCEPELIREACVCPYLWEYRKGVRKAWKRNNVTDNVELTDILWNIFNSYRPEDMWWGEG